MIQIRIKLANPTSMASGYATATHLLRARRPYNAQGPSRFRPGPCLIGGATGVRTPDLRNAIAALSQLSYDPKILVAGSLAPKPATGN